jgi:hypothetical protein
MDALTDVEKVSTDAGASGPCRHEGCRCVAPDAEYCSDHCREAVVDATLEEGGEGHACGCGHPPCDESGF